MNKFYSYLLKITLSLLNFYSYALLLDQTSIENFASQIDNLMGIKKHSQLSPNPDL